MARAPSDEPLNYFPDDVLIQIFLKLPVASLFLFRSVSKRWLALFQSPSFIDFHLNNHINNKPLLIFRISNCRKSAITSDVRHVTLESVSRWIYSRGLWFDKGRLLGPYDGLFCVTDTVDIVIFNPATKQHREVFRLPVTSTGTSSYRGGRWCHHGLSVPCFDRVCFGFDSVTRDYKVIGFRNIDQQQFLKNNDTGDDVYSNIASVDSSDCDYYLVEIYSLSTDTWTQINRVALARDVHGFRNRKYDLFFNNAVHWLGCHSRIIRSIVVFDLNKEVFKQFKLPTDNFPYIHDDDLSVYFSVLDECFTVVVPAVSDRDDEIEIWVMKEYGVYNSWTKLFNISVGKDIIRKPLSFSKDGEFFLRDIEERLVSLNLNTREIKKLGVAAPKGISMFAFRYRESLVSLKNPKKEKNVQGN